MITAFQQILDLFIEIEKNLPQKADIFAIGGMVLLHQGLKPATKDIDLVVAAKDQFTLLEATLKEIGFHGKIPTPLYARFNISQIFMREDFRIDLFQRAVCGEFFLSPGMRQRAIRIMDSDKLSLFLCSNEDILLFKSMTEREGDLDDCLALAKRGLQWNVILEELRYQMKHTGNKVWVTWVGERLDLLQERGLNIPIMPEIDALRFEYYEEWERKLSKDSTSN